MPTIARNHPCPCGSGKKYKLCCLAKIEADQRAAREAVLEARRAAEWSKHYRFVHDDPLTNLSNEAGQLIRAGRLDEAAAACQRLLDEYPDDIDGHERTAQLLEARGESTAAAESMRRALAQALTLEGFEQASYDWMRAEIARLDGR